MESEKYSDVFLLSRAYMLSYFGFVQNLFSVLQLIIKSFYIHEINL